MKFKGIDPDGNFYFGQIDNETLTLCNATDGKTNVIRIRRYVADDKNGNEVYEGDTVILPKKKFTFTFCNDFDADGSEFRVPFAHEPKPFTSGALAIIISYSKLKRS